MLGGINLSSLIAAADDVTGKEDLMEHLRMECLQKAAFENGCTKIILGTCTSPIACHVLEATVKEENPTREGTIVPTPFAFLFAKAHEKNPTVPTIAKQVLKSLRDACPSRQFRILPKDSPVT